MPELSSRVGRVRFVGTLEGISFLVLVGVAMPLKHFLAMPMAVKWVGWIHGLLFIGYALVLLHAFVGKRLTFRKSLVTFVCSLLPFGPFLMDRKLEVDEKRETAES